MLWLLGFFSLICSTSSTPYILSLYIPTNSVSLTVLLNSGYSVIALWNPLNLQLQFHSGVPSTKMAMWFATFIVGVSVLRN